MLDHPESSPVFYRDMTKDYPVMDRGEGVYLFDEQGNRYLDAAGGIAVVNIGHGVAEIAEAAAGQARRLAFAYSGTGTSRPQIDLAKRLAAMASPRVWAKSKSSSAVGARRLRKRPSN